MSSIDDKWAAKVAKTLNAKGKAVNLVTITEGAYNPATGDVSKSETETAVKVRVGSYDNSQVDGTIIKVGDIQILAGDITFDKTSQFEFDGFRYDVVNYEGIYAQDDVVLWKIQARKNGTEN